MKPVLVDVAFGAYNHAEHVSRAIESVLRQKTKFGVRLVIADDCSTDGTRAIVSAYEERYSDQIETFLDDKHRGLLDSKRAYIRVLNHCNAKYIATLEGDDYWCDINKLQKQVDFLESHPEFALCHHRVRIMHHGVCGNDRFTAQNPPVSSVEDLIRRNVRVHTCSLVMRNMINGCLPKWYHKITAGDYVLSILAADGGKVGFMNETMGVYRRHPKGVSSQLVEMAVSRQRRLRMILRHLKTYYYLNKQLDRRYEEVFAQEMCKRLRESFSYFKKDELSCAGVVNILLYVFFWLFRTGRFRDCIGVLCETPLR